jgi:replicative superfamily II helicase
VELMRGVAAEGVYQYRTFNDGIDGSEPFEQPDSIQGSFDTFIRQIHDTQNSTLVFLKSRMDTVEAAFRLAASVKWPEAKKALAKLDNEEPSFLIRSLRQALSRGVAFHSSDLSPRQRLIIEQAFIDKEVIVLFSTTTLAMGVNLSADTVYLETVRYASGKYNRKPSLVPVSRSEFENMSGRAGRFQGGGNGPGRAIILAENEFDKDILWETYIASQNTESVKSAFDSMPVEDWLLDMIVCGLISSADRESVDEVFSHSLHYRIHQQTLADSALAVLKDLVAEGFVCVNDETAEIKSTVFGYTVARAGHPLPQKTAAGISGNVGGMDRPGAQWFGLGYTAGYAQPRRAGAERPRKNALPEIPSPAGGSDVVAGR